MSMIQEQCTKRKRCTPTRILPAVPMTSTKRLGLVEGWQEVLQPYLALERVVRAHILFMRIVDGLLESSARCARAGAVIFHVPRITFAIVLGVLFAVVSEVMTDIIIAGVEVFRILGIICKTG